ncbi:MAG: threonine/homoserine/homoserine lactone efflux protein [Cryomorphaceae bacterium]
MKRGLHIIVQQGPGTKLIYTNRMNEYSFLLAIGGVLFAGAMSPGPSFLVVAQNSLSKSRAHGLATAIGTALGVAIFAVLASFGVTTLIEKVPSAFVLFKILGGGYLLYLAIKIWRGAKQPLAVTDNVYSASETSLYKSFSVGLVTQTSNPKTALVIAGIFAAFVPAQPPAHTTLLVALIAFVIDFSWYAAVAVTLSTDRSRGVYTRAKTSFDRVAAVFLGAVGIRLLLAKLELS